MAKERANSIDKSREQFEKENLNVPVGEIRCLTAYDGEELVGASMIMLRPKDASPFMNYLVPEKRLGSDLSVALLERSMELCEENGESDVQLSPKLYSEEFIDFFRAQGFEKHEEYPAGLWMRKELTDLEELEVPEGIDIVHAESLGDDISAEELAEVQWDEEGSDQDFEDVVAMFEQRDSDRDILYSAARLDESGETVGTAMTMFVDMLSGEKVAHNGGLMVKEEHRNKGIGGALLVDSFHRTKEKGYEKMYISTHSKNPAQKLYRRKGFELVNEHPFMCCEID